MPHQATAVKLAADHRRVARLRQIISEKSYEQGPEFTLASGAKSKFYFDMKPTAFDPEGATLIAELILDELANRPVDFIGGLEMGAVPVIAAVAMKSFGGLNLPGLFVRKEAKGHGTRRLVEGIEAGASVEGKNVVLVEDVTTSGGSVMKAVEAVREAGGSVDTVITIVDRQEGATTNLRNEGIELVALLTADDFLDQS
jgi:orotate phosphoribosyltransferase